MMAYKPLWKPFWKPDRLTRDQIIFHVMEWPDPCTQREFNTRLRALITDTRKQTGLTYWPQFGKMPKGHEQNRGWYKRNGRAWELVLSDDAMTTAATLGDFNIWFENGHVHVTETREAITIDLNIKNFKRLLREKGSPWGIR